LKNIDNTQYNQNYNPNQFNNPNNFFQVIDLA